METPRQVADQRPSLIMGKHLQALVFARKFHEFGVWFDRSLPEVQIAGGTCETIGTPPILARHSAPNEGVEQ